MKERTALFLVLIAFAIVLGACVVSLNALPRRLAEELNGGDAYAYLYSDAADRIGSSAEVGLWIEATGPLYDVAWWISPAAADRNAHNDLYWSMPEMKGSARVLRPGALLTGKNIERGDYIVEFSARNGSWVQVLDIARKETISVDRAGKRILAKRQ